MKMMKKYLAIPLALLVCAPMALTACSDGDDSTPTHTHTYANEWSSDETNHWHAATCEHADEKSDVAAHADQDNDGNCDVCNFTVNNGDNENPDDNGDNENNTDDRVYKQFTYDPTKTDPLGSAYNRYEGEEGEYLIELSAGKTNYYSFSVNRTGTYALTTLEVKTGFSITRVDANEHYVNETETYPATLQTDNTWISEAVCPASYTENDISYWRATYKITSNVNGVVAVKFSRIGDAPREPETIITPVTAQEIVGKAQNPSETDEAKEVPWLSTDNPSYFYDEDYEMTFYDLETGEERTARGFYRYGEESNVNAPVIWVAITKTPPRYFEGDSFSTISASNLVLQTGTDPETGNYLLNNYVDFIMNNGGRVDQITGEPEPGDEDMLCYMNAVNNDGLYPVNQELFDFLQYYVKKNPPIVGDDVNIEKADFWLAPCYYYEARIPGSEGYPIVLTESETSVSVGMTNTYYKIDATTEKRVTIEGSAGLIAYLDGKNHGVSGDGFSITVDVPVGGITFILKTATPGEYTVTVTDAPIS